MDKLKQWVALTVLGALAIAAGGWFVLVSPKRSDAAELRAEAETVSATNASLRNELKVLQAQAKDLTKERGKLSAVAVKLPSNPALPGLIRAISKASDASGVTFVSLEPSEPVVDAGSAPTSAGVLTRIPVTITVVGGYFQVQALTAAMENLPRAYRVENLSIKPGAAPSDVDPSDTDGSSLETVLVGEVFMASPAPLRTATAQGSAAATGSGAAAPASGTAGTTPTTGGPAGSTASGATTTATVN